jgi:DNA-directed RNA polymerase specialized sigma24 family protein
VGRPLTDNRNQEELKHLISYYEQKIFALALYLIAGDRNKAYDVASSSFAETIQKSPSVEPIDSFLAAVAARVIEKSRIVKAMPSSDEIHWVGVADQEKGILRIVSQALQALSFDEKALVLLRDQLNLPYRDMAMIFQKDEKNVQAQTLQARSQLREKIEGWTHHGG